MPAGFSFNPSSGSTFFSKPSQIAHLERIGALMMITQWAGINVITSYMVNIFVESGSSLDPGLAPILVCTVQQALAMFSTGVLRSS